MKFRSKADREPFSVVLEQISSAFARVSPGEIGPQIEHWLKKICDSLGLDRSVVAEFLPEKGGLQVLHQWTREGYPPMPMYLADEIIPWITSRLRAGETFVMPSVRSLPAEADRDREFVLSPTGPKASVVMPLEIGGKVIGGVTFGDFHGERRWSPALLRRFKLISNIFANAIARQRSAIESKRLQEEAQKLANFALLGEMTAAMVHELNHPLGAILANAQTARHMLERASPNLASLREVVDDIIAGERRANDYMQRVRSVFGNNQLRTEPLQIDELLTAVASLVQSDMLMRSISLQIDVEAGLPSIKADRTGIEQVMLNLLRNAADAIATGNSSIRYVRVRAFQQDLNCVTVAVSDTGGGIDQKNFDMIFEPLFTTKEKGTGMGLTIVRSIVESHGGAIRVSTSPGPGATFEFTVPVSS
jgi:signal transduction histidine kinase